MVGPSKTFNSKIVSSVEINAGDATKVIQRLLKLEQDLTAELKKVANEAVLMNEKFASSKSEDHLKALKTEIGNLTGKLKELGAVSKTTKVLGNNEVREVKELEAQVASLAATFRSLQRQSKIEKGNLGLDTKDVTKAISSLKSLQQAQDAVNQALSTQGKKKDPELLAYKKRIEDNTQALLKHIDTLRNATAVEKAHEQALRENAARNARAAKKYADAQAQAIAENIKRDKAEQDEKQRNRERFLTWWLNAERRAREQNLKDIARQKEMEYRLINSGSAQTKLARTQLDFTQVGRSAAAYQFQLQTDRANLLANPAFQAQDQARRKRLQDERTLAEIYRQAGTRPEIAGFARSTTDQSEARKRATQEIVGLQRQLVDLQQRGVLTDQESLRLRTEIARRIQAEAQARTREGNRQAQQNQAERNLARVQGQGGASLLLVQAALSANYAILNGIKGTMRAAVTNSVELEAALQNVRAVTNTTATEMAGLTEKIKEVAAASKFSSLEVANAALTLGQAGMSAKDVGESIQSVAMLAAASGTSLAQAVDLVTSVVGVFDKNANDVTDVANKITSAANNSKVSVDKLALAFQYAGNTAAQSGVSFEETTAALSAMSNAGIRSGSTMGTGLRQFLVEVQKPSEEFLTTIRRLGLDLGDLDFKAHGLIGVAKRLREAGFIASDAIKSFDVRGAAAFNAMIANPEDMQRQFDLMQESRAGFKANEIQMDSLQAQTTRLTTAMTNLASVGLAPISKALQGVLSSVADTAQGMSHSTKEVQAFAMVLTGVAVTAMASYTASIAMGAISLLRLGKAAEVASKSMTMLSVAQAAGARLKAVWDSVSLAATVAVAQFQTTAARQGVLTASTNLLTGALVRLRTAMMGMSVVTGLGLVATVAATAYFLLSDSAETTKDKLDALKGKSDEAVGAFETQKETIESLTNRINELSYRASETKTSKEDLKSMVIALNSEFGAIGVTIDSNTNSYGEMIKKLKEARGEMKELAKAQLTVAITDTKKEVDGREEVVGNIRTRMATNIGTVIDRALKRQKDLMPGQAQILKSVYAQFAAGKTPNASELANTQAILTQLEGKIDWKGAGNYGDKEKFEKFSGELGKFIAAVSDFQESKGRLARLEGTRDNNEATEKYRGQTITVGGKPTTIGEAVDTYGGNIRAKSGVDFGDAPDRVEAFNKFKTYANTQRLALEELDAKLKADLNKEGANKAVITETRTEVKKQLEGIKSEVLRAAGETQKEADRQFKNEERKLAPVAAMPGKENKPKAAEAIRKLGVLKKNHKTRGLIDPREIAEAEESFDEATEQRAQNKLYTRPTTGRSKRDLENEEKERIARYESEALIRAAEADKSDASLTEDLELANQLWENGLKKLGEAREKALQAMEFDQKGKEKDLSGPALARMRKVWADEREAKNLEFDSRVRQFEDTFKGFGKVAGGVLLKMEQSIKKSQQELENMKFRQSEDVYEASAKLRDLELIRDLGKRVRTPGVGNARYDYQVKRGEKGDRDSAFATTIFGRKGVSVTNGMSSEEGDVKGSGAATSKGLGGTLRERIAKEVIRVSEMELWYNEEYLEKLGDENSGLIGQYSAQLALAEKTYEETKARIAELEALQKGGTISQDQRKELRGLQANVGKQGEAVDGYRSKYNGYRGERKAALKENTELQSRIAKNTEELPEELSLENINKRIEEVRDNWFEAVRDMNGNKVIADGISGILGNMTGNLGNTFAQILSGTKSISAGFRDMATSIIKSLLDIAAQAAAMQIFKTIVSMWGGSDLGADVAPISGGSMSVPQTQIPMWGGQGVASGGYVTPRGKIQRFANGGPVTGAVRGRDSVPAILMPGEFVMKQSAVNAVGTDFLHSLNQAGTSVVSSPMSKAPETSTGQPHVTNVWVVTPDQQPTGMGPNDVVAVVSDNITRGGSVKKLIKQVVSNQI